MESNWARYIYYDVYNTTMFPTQKYPVQSNKMLFRKSQKVPKHFKVLYEKALHL